MGKRLIQQRRGRTQSKFNSPSHRFRGEVKYTQENKKNTGIVEDIIHDPGRTAPLAKIKTDDKKQLMIAPEGMKVGEQIKFIENKKELNGI